jgi:hypothetical protein
MNVFPRAAALVAACALIGADAHGTEVVTGAGLNYKNIDMSFEQDIRVRPVSGSNPQLDGSASQDMSFDAWQPFLQASVAVIAGDYYVAANGETGIYDEGTDIEVDQQRSDGLAVNLALPYVDRNVDVKRNDLGITVGWRGIDRVALFAGFKYGKTDFTGDEAEREFVTSGPLLGASYSVPFDKGVLTLGGAVARMSGKYDEDGSANILAEKIDGDANGFSTFINWSAPLGDRLRYLAELRWQRYDFDGSDSSVCSRCTNQLFPPGTPVHVDKDFSMREMLYGAGVSLVYAL